MNRHLSFSLYVYLLLQLIIFSFPSRNSEKDCMLMFGYNENLPFDFIFCFIDQAIIMKKALSKTKLLCFDWLINKNKRHIPTVNWPYTLQFAINSTSKSIFIWTYISEKFKWFHRGIGSSPRNNSKFEVIIVNRRDLYCVQEYVLEIWWAGSCLPLSLWLRIQILIHNFRLPEKRSY